MRSSRTASQLPLPLPSSAALTRADFIVAPANAKAVALMDAWPDWPISVVALYGPAGCGKTHLVSAWQERSGARLTAASAIAMSDSPANGPLAIEDLDSSQAAPARDAALFSAFENARPGAALLLTGRSHPGEWGFVLPDLASRFRAVVAMPLWAPDDGLLASLARKLFADRQLAVPEAVIAQMLRLLERSPAAIREFVADADSTAMAEGGPVNLSLVRGLIAARERAAP